VASSVIGSHYGVVIDEEVQTNSTKYVEAVESCYEEEERCKIGGPYSL
jgi:hypothetical protein